MAAVQSAGATPAMAAATLRHQVLSFRIHELQKVAERLGLKKTGRKAELQSRVLAYFGQLDPASQEAAALGRSGPPRVPREQWRIEHAAKAVNDVYCQMMGLPLNAASDQSAHSSLQLPGQPGVGGSAAAYATSAAAAAAAAGAAAPGQRYPPYPVPVPAAAAAAFAQQYAQPPAAQYQQAAQYAVQQQQPYGVPPRRLNVRCFCGVAAERGKMVQCQGRGCGVSQHADCVGLGPELPGSKALQSFRCELCRARLADPFWEATEQILPPVQLKPQPGRPPVVTSQGQQEVQCADRVFYLNRQQLDSVQRDPDNHRVQAGCLLGGDEVALRYHWPKHVDLRVNNMPHRPYGRAHNAKMGINQRDDVANIGTMVVQGRNSLSLSAADRGTWVLTLQLARRRTLDQVKQLMAPPETLEAAVARVRREVGGGGGEDSDDDLLISHQVVSLKDPMSGQRMQVPARFSGGASGLQAFDLDSFLSMAQRNRKWQDPTTMANSHVEEMQVDTYMQRVLECLLSSPGVTDVEISAEGQWRPEGSTRDWLDIAADPASVAASLAAAGASSAGAAGAGAGAGLTAVKPEPDAAAADGAPGGSGAAAAAANGAAPAANGAAGGGGEEEFVVSDSEGEEEEDEQEELRKAAAAVRKASSAALDALAGQKRKQPEAEVIDLLSSDDEDVPLRQRQQQGQQAQQAAQPQRQQQQSAAAAPSAGLDFPLRIRLPVRARPLDQPAPAGAQQVQRQAPPGQPPQPALAVQPAARPEMQVMAPGQRAQMYGQPGHGAETMWQAAMYLSQAAGVPNSPVFQQPKPAAGAAAYGGPGFMPARALMAGGPPPPQQQAQQQQQQQAQQQQHWDDGPAAHLYEAGPQPGASMAAQLAQQAQQAQQAQHHQQRALDELGLGELDGLDNEAFLHALFDDF